jgi:MFS family permease
MSQPQTAASDWERVRRARIAVSTGFFLFGLCFAFWAVHIPIVVARLSIEPAVLGLVLIGPALAGLLMQPVSGYLVARHGSRRVATFAVPLGFVAMLTPILSPTFEFLVASAIVAGALNNAADISLNIQSTEVEKARGRPTMSQIHGFFSLGGLAGSVLGGGFIGLGLGDGRGALIVAAFVFAAAIWLTRLMFDLPAANAGKRGKFAFPAGLLLLLALIVFMGNMVEGSVADWSALFLDTVKETGPALAAAGYAVYSLAMAAFRFAGGRAVEGLGERTVVSGGGLVIALGIAIVVFAPWGLVSAIGFFVVAIGAANISPIAISAGARVPGVNPAVGVVAVSAAMIGGFLFGPPLIGFISQWLGLSAGVGFVGLLGVAIAATAFAYRWAGLNSRKNES